MLLYLGRQLFVWKEDIFKDTKKEYEAGSKNYITSLALGLATFIMQASESIITVCFNSSLLNMAGILQLEP